MAEREPTGLEIVASHWQDEIATAEDPNDVHDAIVELGVAHLSMLSDKTGQGIHEIWVGMHGRSGSENLAIVALAAAKILNLANDPFMIEHQRVLKQDQIAAKQQRAGEQ